MSYILLDSETSREETDAIFGFEGISDELISLYDIVKETPSKKTTKFTPPSLEEICEYQDFKYSSNITNAPKSFYNYFQARGWEFKSGSKMKDWKAAFDNWKTREYEYSKKYEKGELNGIRKDDFTSRRGISSGGIF